jgi:hypothetical protein
MSLNARLRLSSRESQSCRRRRWVCRALSACTIAVVLVPMFSVNAGAEGSDPSPPDRSSLPSSLDVFRDRFVRAVELDGGTLVVTPPPNRLYPRRDGAAAEVEAWATGQLMGYRSQIFGFGLATIHMRRANVPAIRKMPAFVGFASAPEGFGCPAMIASPTGHKLPALPSAGEAAVVISARRGGPAVVYRARSEPCGSLAPATLTNVQEEVSIPWIPVGPANEVSLQVKATMPACGSLMGSGSSGSAASMTVYLDAVVPENASHVRCRPARLVDETVILGAGPIPGAHPPLVSASTKILHAATGPVTVVGSQDSSPVEGPTASPG